MCPALSCADYKPEEQRFNKHAASTLSIPRLIKLKLILKDAIYTLGKSRALTSDGMHANILN